MADPKESAEALGPDDWTLIAAFIKAELDRRAGKRRESEAIWKEVDRQVAMHPVARKQQSGTTKDWYPELELPWQAETLEVLAADASRMKFPLGSPWFQASANLSDEYLDRWSRRRETLPLFGTMPFPVKLDQETADELIRAVLEHYHRLYDFQAAIGLFDVEMAKYGTGVVRVAPVRLAHFEQDFRGVRGANVRGPAVVPCSIKETYLDDSIVAVMHEGERLGPAIMRRYYQMLDDVKRAARVGGSERGWLLDELKRLEAKAGPDDKRGQIELIKLEGDLLVPRGDAGEAIFLPDSEITVAVAGGPAVVRYRKTEAPLRSYVVGSYLREDVGSPYGSSPLMKGQPIQEAASSALNDLMATSRLRALPPVAYDRHDSQFAGSGGPDVAPGARWATDRPDLINVVEIGDLAATTALFLALRKQYEDVTGVHDPRRGAALKSHTTRGAQELEASRTVVRTDDWVRAVMHGPLTTILHMEWEIAKRLLRKPQAIPINAAGIEGWVTVAAEDLADEVSFNVLGAAGSINEQERAEKFVAVAGMAMQLAQAGIAMGKPVDLDIHALIAETFSLAGFQNASRFVKSTTGSPGVVPGLAPGIGGVPGAAAGVPGNGSQGLPAGPPAR